VHGLGKNREMDICGAQNLRIAGRLATSATVNLADLAHVADSLALDHFDDMEYWRFFFFQSEGRANSSQVRRVEGNGEPWSCASGASLGAFGCS
jgi:hypothetical protein